jgi:hypothetical protein
MSEAGKLTEPKSNLITQSGILIESRRQSEKVHSSNVEMKSVFFSLFQLVVLGRGSILQAYAHDRLDRIHSYILVLVLGLPVF